MSVTVVLPSQLRELAGGRSAVLLEGGVGGMGTVGDALAALRVAHPAVYDRLLTERRELRPHVNVFVGREDIRWSGGLGTPLADGSEVVILPSVSGG
ncbi:MAG: MoaD/ThiS family protein [Gemmatimonadetes bacterium]|nr:MoaD/ThiS family protein [Gemmatimonadota bacterium]